MWWKTAKTGVSPAAFDRLVKQSIRTNPFYQKLFKHYRVDLKDLWKVTFRMAHMNGRYAETRGDEIFVDEDYLMRNGAVRSMFLIAHELVHWLTRQREQESYFADPEEVQGFTWSVAHELSAGRSWDQIEDLLMPLVMIQLKDEGKAKQFLIQRFKEANRLGFRPRQ